MNKCTTATQRVNGTLVRRTTTTLHTCHCYYTIIHYIYLPHLLQDVSQLNHLKLVSLEDKTPLWYFQFRHKDIPVTIPQNHMVQRSSTTFTYVHRHTLWRYQCVIFSRTKRCAHNWSNWMSQNLFIDLWTTLRTLLQTSDCLYDKVKKKKNPPRYSCKRCSMKYCNILLQFLLNMMCILKTFNSDGSAAISRT